MGFFEQESFSDGSFCYMPVNTVCPMEISTFFRINDGNVGHFKRTLIIAPENSYVNHLEGCTARKCDENQLHTAVIELYCRRGGGG